MNREQIKAEFDAFIEFPEGSNGKFVTTTSTLLFAEHIAAKMAEQAQPVAHSAKHWHDLYVAKCQELHDEKARLGAEIETLELAAIAEAEQAQPAGSLSVRYFRGNKAMTNADFDYYGNLPEGDYTLYTTPPHRQPMTDWQPIETAPKDGTTVIVGRDMRDFGFVRGYAYFDGSPGAFVSGWVSHGFTEFHGNLGLANPTHWMPLPAPPIEAAHGIKE